MADVYSFHAVRGRVKRDANTLNPWVGPIINPQPSGPMGIFQATRVNGRAGVRNKMHIFNQGVAQENKFPDGEINAVVTIKGEAAYRPVYILDQQCDKVLTTHSDIMGHYHAYGLYTDRKYIAIALDEPDREYTAAISDYITPETGQ